MNMNTQTKSYYDELVSPYNDIFKVEYTNTVTEDKAEKRAEEHMKTLINDADKMEEMDLEPIHIRLVSTYKKTMDRKVNRTFLLSQRDADGQLGGMRCIHRFDKHGTLHTYGYRQRLGYKNTIHVWHEEPRPYEQAPTKPLPMKPCKKNESTSTKTTACSIQAKHRATVKCSIRSHTPTNFRGV